MGKNGISQLSPETAQRIEEILDRLAPLTSDVRDIYACPVELEVNRFNEHRSTISVVNSGCRLDCINPSHPSPYFRVGIVYNYDNATYELWNVYGKAAEGYASWREACDDIPSWIARLSKVTSVEQGDW